MFYFGWFIGKGYSVHGWNQPWTGNIGDDWMEPDLYMDLARGLERACFDCMVIEDDVFQGSPEWYLRNASTVPKSDPLPLVPLLGYVTKRLGIVATITTSFYPPYIAARLGATLDHLTHGRVGLNIVTAHNDRSAQNFGLDRHYEHDLRYEMATNGWRSSTGSGCRGSRTPSWQTPRPACSPITPRSIRSNSRAGTTSRAGH